MKTLVMLLLLVVIVSCSEDEIKDPFIGNWLFATSKASFQIKERSSSYTIDDIKINGNTWTRGEVRDVSKKSKIGMIIISENSTSTDGIIFFNCIPSHDLSSIRVDSVWVTSGVPIQKDIMYNQTITRN